MNLSFLHIILILFYQLNLYQINLRNLLTKYLQHSVLAILILILSCYNHLISVLLQMTYDFQDANLGL